MALFERRPAGLISPKCDQQENELDVASLLSLYAQPLFEAATVAQDGVYAVTLHKESDPSSEVVGESLPPGALMHIVEQCELDNGTRRARIVLKGDVVPFGWLDMTGPDGRPSLRPAFARPLYEVVKPPIVRKRFELTSTVVGTLPVGTQLHVAEVRRTSEGVQRCCVVLLGDDAPFGWLTSRHPIKGTVTIREVGKNGQVKPMPDYRVPALQPTMRQPIPQYGSSAAQLGSSYVRTPSSTPRRPSSTPNSARGHLTSSSPVMPTPPAMRAVDVSDSSTADNVRKSSGRAKKQETDERGVPFNFRTIPACELDANAARFLARADEDEAQLEESKKQLLFKLGEELVSRNIKVNELVAKWAKRGEEPVSKQEFRVAVRKFLEKTIKPEVKEIDELFDLFDTDADGHIDVAELKQAFKKLQDGARTASETSDRVHAKAEQLRLRAQQSKDAAAATRAAEKADGDLMTLKDKTNVEARLGQILQARNVKVNEVVNKWDKTGNGVSPEEFCSNVRALGLNAGDEELDGLFKSLDEDGGGTLDAAEIKVALKRLQGAQKDASKAAKQVMKTATEFEKLARFAQWELQQLLLAEEKAEAELAEKAAREEAEREAAFTQQKAARAAAAAEKKNASARARAEFEASVAARRNSVATGNGGK